MIHGLILAGMRPFSVISCEAHSHQRSDKKLSVVRILHNANFSVSVSFLGLQLLSNKHRLIQGVCSRAAKNSDHQDDFKKEKEKVILALFRITMPFPKQIHFLLSRFFFVVVLHLRKFAYFSLKEEISDVSTETGRSTLLNAICRSLRPISTDTSVTVISACLKLNRQAEDKYVICAELAQ